MKSLNHKKIVVSGLFIAFLNMIVFMIWPTTINLFASLFDADSLSGFGFIIPFYALIAVGIWLGIAVLYKLSLKSLKLTNMRHHIQVFVLAQLLLIFVAMLIVFISPHSDAVESDSNVAILMLLGYLYIATLEIASLYIGNLLVNRFIKD